jgi:hypothetical protein
MLTSQWALIGKVHDFDSSGNQHIPCDSMCSFSENTTLKYLKNADILSGWIHHNQKHVRWVLHESHVHFKIQILTLHYQYHAVVYIRKELESIHQIIFQPLRGRLVTRWSL